MSVDIWSNKWFRDLDPTEKCIWLYLNSRPVNNEGEVKASEGMILKAVNSTTWTKERVLKKFGSSRIKEHKTKADTFIMVQKKYKIKGESQKSFTLWFDEVYKKYPKRIGRAEGYMRLSNMMLSENQRQDFELAVDNYNLYIKQERIEDRFIKHFTSFVGSSDKIAWTDWLYWEPKVAKKPQNDADNAIDLAFDRVFK
jgi:hypothetical protein